MYSYVLRCWFVANLLHPVFLGIASVVDGGSITPGDLGIFFVVFIPLILVSLFISLPALLMGWLVMSLLASVEFPVVNKFYAWLLSTIPVIFLNMTILIAVTDDIYSFQKLFRLDRDVLLIMLPSLTSALVASAFCFNRFIKLFKYTQHETNLV
jgi:hypothetical protein